MAAAGFDTFQRSPAGLTLLGYSQQAVTTLAPLDAPPTGNVVMAIIGVEGGNVRWRADGTNPTASVGSIMWGSAEYKITSDLFAAMELIAMTGTTPTLNIEWYGNP